MAAMIKQTTFASTDVSTLQDAFEEIKRMAASATPENRLNLTLETEAPRYLLFEPLVLSAEEVPGLAYVDLTVRPREGFHTILSGCDWIRNHWFEKVEGTPYYKYQFPKDEDGKYPVFRDFYVNRKRIKMAESNIMIHPFALPPVEERENPENLKGIYLPIEDVKKLASIPVEVAECQIYIEWTWRILRIVGTDLNDTKECDGKTYALVKLEYEDAVILIQKTHPVLNIKNRRCFFSNSPVYLTPGTFTYDYRGGVLYYYPEREEDMKTFIFEYPRAENLLMFEGMSNLTVEGISFTGTTSRYACEHGYASGQANCASGVGRLKHAGLYVSNVNRLTVKNCTFEQLGANGLMIQNRSVGVRVNDCIFKNIGMSGLSIGNPTTDWDDPKNQNFDVRVENNYFEHIAYGYPTAAAFYMGMVDGLRFRHNTMIDTAYSAVSVGWGWNAVGYHLGEKVNVRDADISYNYLEDYMNVLQDGAAIYTVGANCLHDNPRRFNRMHDNYGRRNVLSDSGRRGFYMDGSSTNWETYRNVSINTQFPVFSQFHWPPAGTFHNHMYEIYATFPVDKGNHAPARDTILGSYYDDMKTEEELLAKYETAREIRANAGCNLVNV